MPNTGKLAGGGVEGGKEIVWGCPNEEQRDGSLSTAVLLETEDYDSP